MCTPSIYQRSTRTLFTQSPPSGRLPSASQPLTVAATINEEFKLELDINSASKERRRGALGLSETNGSRVDQEGSSAFPK